MCSPSRGAELDAKDSSRRQPEAIICWLPVHQEPRAGRHLVRRARAVAAGKGPEWGLSLATPVIVKYRDSRTDTRTELEQWIR